MATKTSLRHDPFALSHDGLRAVGSFAPVPIIASDQMRESGERKSRRRPLRSLRSLFRRR